MKCITAPARRNVLNPVTGSISIYAHVNGINFQKCFGERYDDDELVWWWPCEASALLKHDRVIFFFLWIFYGFCRFLLHLFRCPASFFLSFDSWEHPEAFFLCCAFSFWQEEKTQENRMRITGFYCFQFHNLMLFCSWWTCTLLLYIFPGICIHTSIVIIIIIQQYYYYYYYRAANPSKVICASWAQSVN